MKKLMWLGAIVVALVTINARLEASRECGCYPECWCRQPGLRHFRWVLPWPRHYGPWESDAMEQNLTV
ncbi:MAG: hypothetical protein M3P01_13605 [Actinomycetota bacterium]|nr:hypothetical protein [Actinomycetota bacterium]